MDLFDLSMMFLKTLLIFLAMVQVAPVMLWVERRACALMQDRPGPNRVGPFGLFQPIADFVKFLWKNEPIPDQANRLLYVLAPFLALIPASLTIAALPVGDFFEIAGRKYDLQIADLDIGLLYMLSISSLGIYGILFGGWASNNKFSLIGAMRSSAQIISYEIPLGVAAVGAVLWYGTLNLREMVDLQEGLIWGVLPNWGVFYQPLGFFVFLVCAFAETNRLPFDLPETEAELVAGYHTEYPAMKCATYFLAEYMSIATISGLMISLYFGGWHLPWISDGALSGTFPRNIVAVIQVATFFTKVALFMCLYVWIRWTLPRFRFDQLMHLAWRNLIPLALINLAGSALLLFLLEGL